MKKKKTIKEIDITYLTDLDKIMDWLHEMNSSDKGLKEDMKFWLGMSEDDATLSAHHTIGQNLRNTLKLWHDGPSVKWFNDHGIHHADDMSSIILTSFHRKYNKKDILLEEQIKVFRDFWAERDPKVNTGLKD